MITYHFSMLKGKCPECSRKNIKKIRAAGARASSSSKMPEANIEVWQCDACKHIFQVIK